MKANKEVEKMEKVVDAETVETIEVETVHVDTVEETKKKGLIPRLPKPLKIAVAIVVGIAGAIGIYEVGKKAGRCESETGDEEPSEEEWLNQFQDNLENEISEENEVE